ncbi:hypothetical protein LJC18_02560 [Lachnospiraceae bacterium OttesenSCG-928-E19]|nr:hypothetical protein [Lachnospiraceae bacterium OttesenSCG-928-E19]
MNNQKKGTALSDFRSGIVLMGIYSFLLTILGVLGIMGVALPSVLSDFEQTNIEHILSILGGLVGVVGAIIAPSAVSQRSIGKMWLCSLLGVAQIALTTVVIFMANIDFTAHLGVITSILWLIPANFAGRGVRVAAKGWDS